MSRTVRWTIGIAIVASAVIFGITCLVLVRYGNLDSTPWQTIGIAVGAVGALGGFMLGVVESEGVVVHESRPADQVERAHSQDGA